MKNSGVKKTRASAHGTVNETKNSRIASTSDVPVKIRRTRRKRNSDKASGASKSSAVGNESVKIDRLALIKLRHEAMKREIDQTYEDMEPEE
ncbi:MAG: hypothetical protein V1899_08985 [Planctomycetota bacterium]